MVRVAVPDPRNVEAARTSVAVGPEEVTRVEVVPIRGALGPHVASRRHVDDEHPRAVAPAEQHAAALVRVRGGGKLADAALCRRRDGRGTQVHRPLRP